MTNGKYTANIITKTREYTPEELARREKSRKDAGLASTITMERLLWLDDNVIKGSEMYMECIWLWEGETTSGLMQEPHAHDFDEVIGFIGSDPDNPRELDAVIEVYLGDEVHYLEKSCLLYIPAGMVHCPMTFKKVNQPVFFFTIAPTSNYTSAVKSEGASAKIPFSSPEPDKTGTKYARYIVTKPKEHAPSQQKDEDKPKTPPPGNAKATHMVSLDSEAIPGSFYVDLVWIWSGTMTMAPEPHSHDFDELIGIVSQGDKNDPRTINGDISVTIEGEPYALDKSSIVYVPKNVTHCPIEFKDVEKPVLCFTIGNTRMWDKVTQE